MKCVFVFLIVFCPISILWCNTSDTTYIRYHQLVNQAERFFYLDNNVDSALHYYDTAFAKFDFIFLRDLMNVAQISIFTKKPYKSYLLEGFRFGLTFKHLEQFPLIQSLIPTLKADTLFVEKCKANRQIYIKSLNLAYLIKIYDLGIQDQIQKNKTDEAYATFKLKSFQEIITLTKTQGFPSAKVTGIDAASIFQEVGKPTFDIDNRKKRFSSKLDYYSTDDNTLSATRIMVILIHNQCVFPKSKEMLYDAMLKGEIHPREIGLLYDNIFRNVNSKYYKCHIPSTKQGVFYLNIFCKYNNLSFSQESVNKIRCQWHVVELEVDEKKREYQDKYGFKSHYGFWNCM